MSKKRMRIVGQLRDRALKASQTVMKRVPVVVGAGALVALGPTVAEALRFLGCDWYIEGSCLVGYCDWPIVGSFVIYLCVG